MKAAKRCCKTQARAPLKPERTGVGAGRFARLPLATTKGVEPRTCKSSVNKTPCLQTNPAFSFVSNDVEDPALSSSRLNTTSFLPTLPPFSSLFFSTSTLPSSSTHGDTPSLVRSSLTAPAIHLRPAIIFATAHLIEIARLARHPSFSRNQQDRLLPLASSHLPQNGFRRFPRCEPCR